MVGGQGRMWRRAREHLQKTSDDVGAPDVVRSLHRQMPEQIRVNAVLWVRIAGPRPLVDRAYFPAIATARSREMPNPDRPKMVMFRTILSTSVSLGLLSIRLIISAWHKPNQYSKPLSAASSRTIPCAAAAAKSSRRPWFRGCEAAVDWPWLRTRTALRFG